MAGDEIQRAVDELAHRLRRSVVINDPGVHLLYTSPHFGDEDEVRIRAVLQRDAGTKAIGHVLAQGVTGWTTAGVIPPNDELGMKARVCVPVRWRGELLGLLIVMDADGTLTTGELAGIDEVARDIAPVLAASTDSTSSYDADREQLVLDLLSNEPALRRRALADLAPASRPTSTTVIALSVRRAENAATAHRETALRTAMQDRFAREQLCAVDAGQGYLLVGTHEPDALRDMATRILGRVRDLASGHFTCVAGIGSSLPGLERAHESAAQARLAARAAGGLIADDAVLWSELGAYGPLLRIPDLTADALPDEVQRLLAVDRDGTLTASLRAYLDHGCLAPAAAEALHIHRTTLYYRLGRITELTGLDLADGRTRLVLHLGLTILTMLDFRQ